MNQEILPGCRLIQLEVKGDERGSLIAIQGGRDVPFDIARAYYVFGTVPGVTRGLHAHRRLRQMAIAVHGGCDMMLDDGRDRATVRLEDPALALTIPPMVWHEMSEFSHDCVLLVLAEALYDEADYIRDFDEFRALVTSG